jgi:hypothetical protein
VFFRGIRRWRWSRILGEFLVLFPGPHRTEKGLTTVYYRTLVEWKMEKSGKDSRYYEKDLEEIVRRAKQFSTEFLIKLRFFD